MEIILSRVNLRIPKTLALNLALALYQTDTGRIKIR